MSIVGSLIRIIVERRAAKTNLDEISQGLETSGEQIAARMTSTADTPANRRTAGHIIGIERWGAHRLQSGLTPAAALVIDEYDGYCPLPGQPLSELADEFRRARADTLALLETLRAQADCRVPHNMLGDLSVPAWFMYLSTHAGAESKKIR